MFIDRVKLKVQAGNGGNGMSAFRREKYVPLGGPSGGDGGDGGDIVFTVDEGKSTLLDLRYNKKIKASDGVNGKTKKMHGARAENFVIRVPLGTLIKDLETGEVLADLTRKAQNVVICKGGRGGRGNYRFKSSKNSAPTYAEKGGLGESKEVEVELKVLADVGLVGFPSVGKSTLLSVVSAAKPEIADYPFTTLVPNLGMVQVQDGRSFVMADLPGLIKGASLGKGLGIQFLKHIERCRVIVHVIDMGAIDHRDPIQDYQDICDELSQYKYQLLKRPQIVVANKMDVDGAAENLVKFKAHYPDLDVFETITLIQEGMDKLIYKIADVLAEEIEREKLSEDQAEDTRVIYTLPQETQFQVVNRGNHRYELVGKDIEEAYHMANFDSAEGEQRFARKMRKMGVDKALRDAGCVHGDLVSIKKFEFEFVDE